MFLYSFGRAPACHYAANSSSVPFCPEESIFCDLFTLQLSQHVGTSERGHFHNTILGRHVLHGISHDSNQCLKTLWLSSCEYLRSVILQCKNVNETIKYLGPLHILGCFILDHTVYMTINLYFSYRHHKANQHFNPRFHRDCTSP